MKNKNRNLIFHSSPWLKGLKVVFQEKVVVLRVELRHDDLDIPVHDLHLGVPEKPGRLEVDIRNYAKRIILRGDKDRRARL